MTSRPTHRLFDRVYAASPRPAVEQAAAVVLGNIRTARRRGDRYRVHCDVLALRSLRARLAQLGAR
jgi:hypothetical protein